MAKTLTHYRDAIREIRAAGISGFSASDGYKLSGPISAGRKAWITRNYEGLAFEAPVTDEPIDDDFILFEFEDQSEESHNAWGYEYEHDMLDDLIDEFDDVDMDDADTGGIRD